MYFPDELWDIVKEYAGIYSVGTNFNVSKVSRDNLLGYYSSNFNRTITNPSKYKAEVVKKMIMNDIRFRMTEMKLVALWNLCNPIKEKRVKTISPNLVGKIGEQISWRDSETLERCLGEIVGLYCHSYKVRRFKTAITNVETHPTYRYGRFGDPIDNFSYTTHTYIKDKYYKGFYNVGKYEFEYLSNKDGHKECFRTWTHIFNPYKEEN